MSAKGVSTITRSHPVNHQLRLDIPHAASRPTTAQCSAPSSSRADVVSSEAAEGLVKGCGWHGMEEVRRQLRLKWRTSSRA
jgi:hypothetical protein